MLNRLKLIDSRIRNTADIMKKVLNDSYENSNLLLECIDSMNKEFNNNKKNLFISLSEERQFSKKVLKKIVCQA